MWIPMLDVEQALVRAVLQLDDEAAAGSQRVHVEADGVHQEGLTARDEEGRIERRRVADVGSPSGDPHLAGAEPCRIGPGLDPSAVRDGGVETEFDGTLVRR